MSSPTETEALKIIIGTILKQNQILFRAELEKEARELQRTSKGHLVPEIQKIAQTYGGFLINPG